MTKLSVRKKLFKSHAYKLLISSTKSMHGHLIGITDAVELFIGIK